MGKKTIRLSLDKTINKFIKRVLVFLLISSFFWLFVVIIYFEYRTKIGIDKILQTEYEAIITHSGSFEAINRNTIDESIKEKIEKAIKKHDIFALEIYLDGKTVFKSISDGLPPTIQTAFNSKLMTDKISFKDSILLPSGGNIYLLSISTFDDKTIKVLKRLSSDEAKELDRDIFTILFIAISSIVLTAAIIFPLVYSQYKKLAESERMMLQANLNILNALGKAISKRDNDTHEHNYRVTYYSLKIAESYGLNKVQLQGIVKGAFLHDIGKIAISDTILLKPGKLTKEEFEVIKTHVRHGEEIVENIEWLDDARIIVADHHEKFDGSGYPSGKKGEEIPIEARIFAVADVFDALTSVRPYKNAYSYNESMEIIKEGVGSHFDEKVVEVFVLIAKNIHDDIIKMDRTELESMLLTFVEKIWNLK